MDNGIAWLFLQIADHYAWLNPHMTLRVDVFGQRSEFTATDQSWVKWKPSDPTSPHWYTVDHLERLVAAHISHNADLGQDTNAREFVGTFRGLSASAKQKAVLEAAGLTRARLSDLVTDGTTDRGAIARLLDAMKTESRPVEPRLLGLIGEHHLRTRFEAIGCEMDSFAYRKAMGVDDDVPWILEAAFGYLHKPRESHDGRVLVSGVNWSPSIINPFRSLGKYRTFDGLLNQQYVRPNEPVMVAIHLACARVEYLDRGKSTLVLS